MLGVLKAFGNLPAICALRAHGLSADIFHRESSLRLLHIQLASNILLRFGLPLFADKRYTLEVVVVRPDFQISTHTIQQYRRLNFGNPLSGSLEAVSPLVAKDQ